MKNSKVKSVLVVNKGECPNCKDEIQSNHRHDFVCCRCGKSCIDGGLTYIRVLGATQVEPLYHDDDFEEIRKYHKRGGRGKEGKEELKWVNLCDMSNAWLEAIIEDHKDVEYVSAITLELYKKELEYRKEKGIFVDD